MKEKPTVRVSEGLIGGSSYVTAEDILHSEAGRKALQRMWEATIGAQEKSKTYRRISNRIQDLKDRIDTLEKALRFYADKRNYDPFPAGYEMITWIELDKGKGAREALGKDE